MKVVFVNGSLIACILTDLEKKKAIHMNFSYMIYLMCHLI